MSFTTKFVLITTLTTPSFLWIHIVKKQTAYIFANPPSGLSYMDLFFFNLLIKEVVPSEANSLNSLLKDPFSPRQLPNEVTCMSKDCSCK